MCDKVRKPYAIIWSVLLGTEVPCLEDFTYGKQEGTGDD